MRLFLRFAMDPQWSETGDRYLLKLFRDYLFHQVNSDGMPWFDLSHIVHCLNQVRAGMVLSIQQSLPQRHSWHKAWFDTSPVGCLAHNHGFVVMVCMEVHVQLCQAKSHPKCLFNICHHGLALAWKWDDCCWTYTCTNTVMYQ